LGFQPSAWQQARQFSKVGVAHEFVEDPLEVGERVLAVATDLLDEGVDQPAAQGRLPEKYTTELFEQKCGVLFQHVLEKYPESGESVYEAVG